MELATILGPLIAGMGAGLLSSSMQAKGQQNMNKQMMAMMNQMGQQNVAEMPQTPQNPDIKTGEGQANAEAQEEMKRQQMAAQQAQEMYNPTKGLGITSTAPGQRKTLAGM